MQRTLADDQCQNCNRRKTRLNLTPSHSPLRSSGVSRTKQTRSLSPRSCNCLPTNTGQCCRDGVDSGGSNHVETSLSDTHPINQVSSFDDDSLCRNPKPMLSPNIANNFCIDAGYCSQELSPDGGSPLNGKHKHISRKKRTSK